ncbi:hypothetical protein [Halpernia frigidisoli]|uniref:Uncharacterized protein n=1 Tax=Halpernia frigidisoli TaxID=1125876 RepID=A0A1I3J408_9FLAO|nr:hypothetical protein [Halpernia frigidisoli]SFI54987.1 hypothetical protein SAMN05443292_2924 [Halpernia frigidisoli]
MKNINRIISTYETIENEEITTLKVDKNDGTIIINISKLFEESAIECFWLDDNRQYLGVMHGNWEGSELFGIVNTNGKIIRKCLHNIEEYIPQGNHFIIMVSDLSLPDDNWEYQLVPGDHKMAVIDRYGDFVIPPIYSSIKFFDDENCYYGNNYNGDLHQYSLYGKRI